VEGRPFRGRGSGRLFQVFQYISTYFNIFQVISSYFKDSTLIEENNNIDICALVLAAGKSERMGSQKLLLPFGGKTIIERVIDNILLAGLENILVVTGSHRDEIEKLISTMPITFCHNPHYSDGMHTSVIQGFRSLPENTGAVLVFLGDQPFIPAEVIQTVIITWRQSGKRIIIPTFQGKRGHPTLFDFKLREEILHLDPVSGLRSITVKFPEEILEAEINFPQILKDIDTKSDYLNELNQMN
jgi:molybdenum cofactor cytidylyltransferase